MAQDAGHPADLPRLLTTREVAEILRVKERKVYDMAAAGEIPHRRLTGKLLFPATEISAWIAGGAEGGVRPDVIAGSHDLLLDWAVRESGCGLATLFDGSLDGLTRFTAGDAAIAGMHVPEIGEWNLQTVAAAGLGGAVLISWARRNQGLIIPKGREGKLTGLADLAGWRIALRQPGAGARALFDQLAAAEGVVVDTDAATVRTETEAAAAVAAGDADAALGLEAAARSFSLGFVPLATERFDLLIDRRAYFTDPVQRLMAFAHSSAFAEKAARLGGYDLASLGEVRWLSA